MRTRKQQMTSGGVDGYSNFMGDDTDYQAWLAVPIGRTRDSDDLEESNFAVGLKMLGGASADVRVARYGHWAVGWVEQVYVRPDSPAHKIAEEIEESLENYPILDDDDFSEREQKSADFIWKDCLSVKERIAHIRKYESEFEFRGYADMIGCVRGNYYSGYPSSLLS